MSRIKHKAVIVPYIIHNGKFYVVVVKDKVFNEWTFVTGSCDKNESITDCALRELYEETRGILNLQHHTTSIDKFFQYTFERYIKHNLNLKYRVYVFPLKRFGFDMKAALNLRQRFHKSQMWKVSRAYNETKDIKLLSLDHLRDFKVWNVMENYVINNVHFNQYLSNVHR